MENGEKEKKEENELSLADELGSWEARKEMYVLYIHTYIYKTFIYIRLVLILDAVEKGREGRWSEEIEGKEREEEASGRAMHRG